MSPQLASALPAPAPIDVTPLRVARGGEILTRAALAFLADLHGRFESERRELLAFRETRQQALDAGMPLEFSPATAGLREREWRVRPAPADLQCRTVEITGPVDRKTIINALNSGADGFMADFEDSTAPTWDNLIAGQVNLKDAVARTIDYRHPETGQHYRLADRVATLHVRPRGWHLPEKHVRVDGKPMAGALFDFGLYVFHNHAELQRRGTAPYLYLPKLENRREARLWRRVIAYTETVLGLPQATIRVTVLIETLPVVFEMDEILWELRDHIVGLNCGRWDYIFSSIKCLRGRADWLLPDRATVTMDCRFLKSYVDLLVHTCHRRGAHAMGGMAAQIPIRGDVAANEAALERVRADKGREVRAGHDGTWVAHPKLVGIARSVFGAVRHGPNQLATPRGDIGITPADLLCVPEGVVTEKGVRDNVRVGVRYLEAWLRGIACVPLYHVMEDAATAEICRAQLWQWLRRGARLADGRPVDAALFERLFEEELQRIAIEVGPDCFERGRFAEAQRLFLDLIRKDVFEAFLTLPAYELID